METGQKHWYIINKMYLKMKVLSAKVATLLLRLSEDILSSHVHFLLPHVYVCRCQV